MAAIGWILFLLIFLWYTTKISKNPCTASFPTKKQHAIFLEILVPGTCIRIGHSVTIFTNLSLVQGSSFRPVEETFVDISVVSAQLTAKAPTKIFQYLLKQIKPGRTSVILTLFLHKNQMQTWQIGITFNDNHRFLLVNKVEGVDVSHCIHSHPLQQLQQLLTQEIHQR